MTTYNIIGDIHGRTSWKDLVDETCVNIFVGDYFDPYTPIPFPDLKSNFLEIVDFKKSHPENVVLLYGNHDYEYLPGISEQSSRYDSRNAESITDLLQETASLFTGVAYPLGEKYLVTHAGVTRPWKDKYLSNVSDINPTNMAKAINTLWETDKPAFGFRYNAEMFDFYGESPQHSPIWVRPQMLGWHNLYKRTDVIQIVGHSQVKNITDSGDVVFVDCLGHVTKSKRVTLE